MREDRSRFQILIVDDGPTNIQLLAEALKDDDYDIYFATSAEQALERIAGQAVDLILLDIMMPGVDGYDLCRLWKNDPERNEIPVIFVTAKAEPADEAKGFEVGAVDYITKPISPPVVQARVRTHLELMSQRRFVRGLANIDGLTSIPNRRAFDETLASEIARARRTALPLSVYFLDVDHFKQYNDSNGHLAGDDALKRVAKAIQTTVSRSGDFVSRYGGEEFAIICSNTDAEAADILARRLLDAVAELAIPAITASSGTNVLTISIGAVACCLDVNPGGSDATAILAQADTLLYKAKQNGRNQFWLDRLER